MSATTGSDSIFLGRWTVHLMVDVCPRSSDPDGCRYALPMFWPVMAPQLMADFSNEFCPYLDCDVSATVPPCDECLATLSQAGNSQNHKKLANNLVRKSVFIILKFYK